MNTPKAADHGPPRNIRFTTTAPGFPHLIEVHTNHVNEDGDDPLEIFADGHLLTDHQKILGGRLVATGRDQYGNAGLMVDMTGVREGRPSFHNIMMNMALLTARRSTCLRLQVGTVISSTDFRKTLAMGYNGNATGLPNECDRKGAEAVGNCGCLHSEENAIINCDVPRAIQKIVFVTHLPCVMCAKRLLNLGGVVEVFYLNDYRKREALKLLTERGVRVARYVFPSDVSEEVFIETGIESTP